MLKRIKKNISKTKNKWERSMGNKRSKFNNKYKDKHDTLDQCISYIVSAHGDVEIVFKEDASEEEVERIVEIFQSV